MQLLGERAVPGAGGDGDGRGRRIDLDRGGQTVEGEQQAGAVGEIVEAVSGAEGADVRCVGHERLQLVDASGVWMAGAR